MGTDAHCLLAHVARTRILCQVHTSTGAMAVEIRITQSSTKNSNANRDLLMRLLASNLDASARPLLTIQYSDLHFLLLRLLWSVRNLVKTAYSGHYVLWSDSSLAADANSLTRVTFQRRVLWSHSSLIACRLRMAARKLSTDWCSIALLVSHYHIIRLLSSFAACYLVQRTCTGLWLVLYCKL